MHYYGTRLSENISRRDPEGYLLCLNVPVARTGAQDYLPQELGLPPAAAMVSVNRPPGEVFSPETIASFEGMPVTNDHPPDGVDVENIRRYQRGHAHNIRRGTGDQSDLLLADLIITDETLITAILNGKREISCGYTYELSEENGRYVQRKIRGNHIAVVDAGRAGPRVSIKDHKSSHPGPGVSIRNHKNLAPKNNPERSPEKMKKSLSKALARLAKDGETEAVAEFIEEMIAESPEEEPVTVEVPESREITIDEESVENLVARLDQLITLLTSLLAPPEPAADDDPDEEIAEIMEEVLEVAGEAENPIPPEEIAEIMEEVLDPETSVTLEESDDECEEEQDPDTARDAMRAALLTIRPALKSMSARDRTRACKKLADNFRRVRKAGDKRVYAALRSRPARPAKDLTALGEKIMSARNANYRK